MLPIRYSPTQSDTSLQNVETEFLSLTPSIQVGWVTVGSAKEVVGSSSEFANVPSVPASHTRTLIVLEENPTTSLADPTVTQPT